jgi:argininosuccinate lyase
MSLLAMLKGLPLAYNKDMQEDKEAVFDTVDTVSISLRTAAIVLDNLTVNVIRAREAASTGYLNATELADYLVRKSVPFREAHEAVGKAVLSAIQQEKELDELSLADLKRFSAKFDIDVFDSLNLKETLASKNVVGGTSPVQVKEAMKAAKKYLRNKNGQR